MIDHRDGGAKSRKHILAYVAIFVIMLGFLVTGRHPELNAAYPTFVMGVLGSCGIYNGSNTAIKFFSAKATPPPAPEEDEDESKTNAK